MKTITLLLLPALVLGASARPAQNCARGAAASPCRAAASAAVTLDAADTKALVFQVEEERMARELYTAFAAKWDAPQFRQIPQAEARHEQMLREVAVRGGVALPAVLPGKFADAVLQARYDSLLARGSASSAEALAAGAALERQDLADLQELIGSTKSDTLKTVARNLARASEHHLAALTGETGRGMHAQGERRGGRCGEGARAGCRAET